MPKKRFQAQYSKPQSTVHPSLASGPSASFRKYPATPTMQRQLLAANTFSENNAAPSVNDLISNLRSSQLSPDNQRPASTVITPTLPPALRQLLAHPETPAPTPRARNRRFDENGRRLPSGPPAPRSWLSGSRHAPESMKTYTADRLYPHDVEHLPGLADSDGGEMGLRDMCLRQMARNWDFIKVYEINNLADMPTSLRIRLMSYIAVYGPEEGIGLDGLKSLLMVPLEGDQEAELEYRNLGERNYEFYRLDLSGSVGRSISFKQLGELVRQEKTAGADDTTESWDESISRSLNAPIPHLTHLSLSHPPPNISWTKFLAFSKLVPTLTHLSLAYWPPPSLTPNSITAVMSPRNGMSIQYGGTSFYSFSLDNDFTEAASILKRLATALYGLVYLDLDACCEWAPALRQFTVNSPLGIDWRAQWPLLRTITLRSGWELESDSSLRDILSVRKAFVQAAATQNYLRQQRHSQQWIDVVKEDLEAKYFHLWRSDEDFAKRRAMGFPSTTSLRSVRTNWQDIDAEVAAMIEMNT
ncbi:hypothetical protein B7463_g7863, partial [Scytalidium lignicola]